MLATNHTKFNGLDVWFGHGAGDPGATSSGYQEQEMVRRLQTNLKKYGDKAGINIRFYVSNMYADNNVAWSKGRAVFELHLDSAGTAGQGGHIIIQEGIGGLDAIDKNIIEKLKENFGVISRDGAGYDERSDLANPRRCAAAGINYRLVELFFINDATDRNYFLNNIDEVARDLISAYIGKEVGQATAAPTPAPKPVETPKPTATATVREYTENGTFTATENIYFRNEPNLNGKTQGMYYVGESVKYDRVRIDVNGFVWISWVSASTGIRRWMPTGETKNGKRSGNAWGTFK